MGTIFFSVVAEFHYDHSDATSTKSGQDDMQSSVEDLHWRVQPRLFVTTTALSSTLVKTLFPSLAWPSIIFGATR